MKDSELLLSQLNIPSPLLKLDSNFLNSYQIEAWIKRDDLIHPIISGNKYRKLKGYLEAYYKGRYNGIITFGGAYSNHLYATSGLCALLNIPFSAIVRGLEADLSNSTLSLLKQNKHTVHRVSRAEYREKTNGETYRKLMSQNQLLSINEGGNGYEAQIGIDGLYDEIDSALKDFDMLCVASGTGTTALGILHHLDKRKNCKLNVSLCVRDNSVKERLLSHPNSSQLIITPELWGGFAKKKTPLEQFILEWTDNHSIAIEHVYTGKMLYNIWEAIKKKEIPSHSKIVIIHTGGLRPESH